MTCTYDDFVLDYEKYDHMSLNIDIDTHRKHYAVITDGKIKVRENTFADKSQFECSEKGWL